MSLRSRFREWRIQHLLDKYASHKYEWHEWANRFNTDHPADKATQAKWMAHAEAEMYKIHLKLRSKYGFGCNEFYTVGGTKFLLTLPHDTHIKESIVIGKKAE